MFIDDLKLKKEEKYKISSPKERVFYQFLVGEPICYPTENNFDENEQICHSAFCLDSPSKKDIIEKHRKTQPKKGFHYTTNLIDLCAMAKDYFEQERDNLMSYCEKNTTRDFYILKNLFPNISHYPPIPVGSIDQIALHLYEGDFPPVGWKHLLFRALKETTDLIDIYVVEQGYQQAMDDNPIVHQLYNITYVRNACTKFVEKTERNITWVLRIIIILLVVFVTYWLVPFILKNWDKAEPIMGVVEMLRIPISILIVVFIRYIPDKIKFINAVNDNIINWWFSKKGHDWLELRKILDQLK